MQEIAEVETPQKRCPGCEETKPATPDFFYQDRRPGRQFGLRSVCIECEKKRRDKREKPKPIKIAASGEVRRPGHPRQSIGTPEQCGACGTTTGNILGDVDGRKQYGYLCYRCHKLVQDFHADPARMRKVVVYLKKTRKG